MTRYFLLLAVSLLFLMVGGAAAAQASTLPIASNGSLGDFVPSQDVFFDTDAGTYRIGSTIFSGGRHVTVYSSASATDYVVFDFRRIAIGTGITVTAIGSRPLIMLAQAAAQIDGTVDVSAQSGGDGLAHGGGGGGGGGGALVVFADSVAVGSTGRILARGGDGGSSDGARFVGRGGSGGSEGPGGGGGGAGGDSFAGGSGGAGGNGASSSLPTALALGGGGGGGGAYSFSVLGFTLIGRGGAGGLSGRQNGTGARGDIGGRGFCTGNPVAGGRGGAGGLKFDQAKNTGFSGAGGFGGAASQTGGQGECTTAQVNAGNCPANGSRAPKDHGAGGGGGGGGINGGNGGKGGFGRNGGEAPNNVFLPGGGGGGAGGGADTCVAGVAAGKGGKGGGGGTGSARFNQPGAQPGPGGTGSDGLDFSAALGVGGPGGGGAINLGAVHDEVQNAGLISTRGGTDPAGSQVAGTGPLVVYGVFGDSGTVDAVLWQRPASFSASEWIIFGGNGGGGGGGDGRDVVVGSLNGSASRVGVVAAPGSDGASQIAISADFTFRGSVNLGTSSLTIHTLLNELEGTGELVAGVPLTLTPDASSSTSGDAFFVTPAGARPTYRFEIKNQDPSKGLFKATLKVDRATIPLYPRLCTGSTPTTNLNTTFAINPSGGSAVVITTFQPWRCLDLVGGDPKKPSSLRTP